MTPVVDFKQENSIGVVDTEQIVHGTTSTQWIIGPSKVGVAIKTDWESFWTSAAVDTARLSSQEFIISGYLTPFIQRCITGEVTQQDISFVGALPRGGWPIRTYWTSETRENWTPKPVHRPTEKTFPIRFKSALLRLRSLFELEPDWDSYGAVPPSNVTIIKSIVLLWDLHEYLEGLGENLPGPFVAPVPDGRIQFEWRSGRKEIEIDIGKNGSIQYLLFKNRDMSDYVTGSVSTARELGEVLRTDLFGRPANIEFRVSTHR